MNKKVLLIIPAYNEEGNIVNTINTIENSKLNIDYIVINDGSTDNTLNICRKNNIAHINLIRNLGIGGAVQTGYKYALDNEYDITVQFDGDGQHDINYLEKLIEPILQNQSDMTIGSRFLDEEDNFKSTKLRRIGKTIISLFLRIFTKNRFTDPTSGFRACNKELTKVFAENYPLEYPEPISILEAVKNNFKVSEVSVEMKERISGTSSIKAWKNVYYMINVTLTMFIVMMRNINKRRK